MRKLWPLLIIVALVATVLVPLQSEAHTPEIRELDKKIAEARAKKNAAERKRVEAQNRIRQIVSERAQTEQLLQELYEQIDAATEEIERLDGEIEMAEAHLAETEQLVEEALIRIDERDDLLRKRMQFMYTNGTVTYLEVLLNATSFSDFLSRFMSLQSLISQDKEILAANIRDHELVVQKKNDIVDQLGHLAELHDAQEELIAGLTVKGKEAEVLIASLNEQEQHYSEITEEQQRVAIELAQLESQMLIERENLVIDYYKGGKLGYPLPRVYRVTSEFGPRTHPVTGKRGSHHSGIDFGAPNGTNILAAEDGVVVTAEFLSGYGNTVIINHGSNLMTLYAHIRPNGIKVKKGQEVKRGDVIAEVGTTGTSTGYHLHFEVRLNGKAVNPRDYLNL